MRSALLGLNALWSCVCEHSPFKVDMYAPVYETVHWTPSAICECAMAASWATATTAIVLASILG